MFTIIFGVITRIISNSYLNVFQKMLTSFGQRSFSVNFYTYLGLTILSIYFLHGINFSSELILNVVIMGLLGALGNYFIIKALSIGELSSLAPINSYKPIVALLAGIFYLNEIPNLLDVFGILMIIFGTLFLYKSLTFKNRTAILYRLLALIFSASEAVFIKKVIILTGISQSLALWALSGLLFSFCFSLPEIKNLKVVSYKYQIFLVISVALMQYSTNFVFSKINVSSALALFQLSTILSVFLGAEIFREKDLKRKIFASLIMVFGAVILIINT